MKLVVIVSLYLVSKFLMRCGPQVSRYRFCGFPVGLHFGPSSAAMEFIVGKTSSVDQHQTEEPLLFSWAQRSERNLLCLCRHLIVIVLFRCWWTPRTLIAEGVSYGASALRRNMLKLNANTNFTCNFSLSMDDAFGHDLIGLLSRLYQCHYAD